MSRALTSASSLGHVQGFALGITSGHVHASVQGWGSVDVHDTIFHPLLPRHLFSSNLAALYTPTDGLLRLPQCFSRLFNCPALSSHLVLTPGQSLSQYYHRLSKAGCAV